MAFEPVRGERGCPRVTCICDDCERSEVVAAQHGPGAPDGFGQAITKTQRMGWSYIQKRLRCPACEAKRKAVKVAKNATKSKVVQGSSTQPPREPTRAQLRSIIEMLNDVYDIDAERYTGGETDETVAAVLEVMPGWVVAERERAFGPAGGNADIEALAAGVSECGQQIEAALRDLNAHTSYFEKLRDQVQAHAKALSAIKVAVGPRVMARAK